MVMALCLKSINRELVDIESTQDDAYMLGRRVGRREVASCTI